MFDTLLDSGLCSIAVRKSTPSTATLSPLVPPQDHLDSLMFRLHTQAQAQALQVLQHQQYQQQLLEEGGTDRAQLARSTSASSLQQPQGAGAGGAGGVPPSVQVPSVAVRSLLCYTLSGGGLLVPLCVSVSVCAYHPAALSRPW